MRTEKMGTEELIAEIETMAPAVAAGHEALTLALDDQITAETELLTRLIKHLGARTLDACSTRPRLNATTSGRAEWCGVCLTDKRPGPVLDHARDNSGHYEGSDLFLLPDGTFRELVYTRRPRSGVA